MRIKFQISKKMNNFTGGATVEFKKTISSTSNAFGRLYNVQIELLAEL